MGVIDYQALVRKALFEYLEKYSQVPSHAIAKMLKRDYPALFATVEHARFLVRKYRGRAGIYHRETVKNRKFYQDAV